MVLGAKTEIANNTLMEVNDMQKQITSEMVDKLIDAYNCNKESLYQLDEIIDEHGILDNGVTDIHDTFEMGYNNALQYVFSVLGVVDYDTPFVPIN